MKSFLIPFGLCAALSGCASLPLSQQQTEMHALVQARHSKLTHTPVSFDQKTELTRDKAIAMALLQSPRAAIVQAKLGLARADALSAMRIANPSFGFTRLTASLPEAKQITRHFGLDLADALLLPVRHRFAAESLARERLLLAEQLLDLAGDTETLWWRAVAAEHVARMRGAASDAAQVSADLAERFFEAGNIGQLQRQNERASAASALIAAAKAQARALELHGQLKALLGVAATDSLRLPARLPTPAPLSLERQALLDLAEQQALPIAAARAEVALAERGLKWQKHWRWLAHAELEYERESEREDAGDSVILRGPSLSISLPIFHQNQAEVAHAKAALALAQAELDMQRLNGTARIDAGIDRVRRRQLIVDTYRNVLLRARELIVAEQQARYNFMLIGAFELIHARRGQYDAYEGYIESIRDAWLARIDLQRAVGSELPGSTVADVEAVDIDDLIAPEAGYEQSATPSRSDEEHQHDHTEHAHDSDAGDQP